MLDKLRNKIYSESAYFVFYQYIVYRLDIESDENRNRFIFTSYQIFSVYKNIKLSAITQLNDRLDYLSENFLQFNLSYYIVQQYLTRFIDDCIDFSSLLYSKKKRVYIVYTFFWVSDSIKIVREIDLTIVSNSWEYEFENQIADRSREIKIYTEYKQQEQFLCNLYIVRFSTLIL